MIEQKIEKLIEEAMQEIQEAVHRNHPWLDKTDPSTKAARNHLAKTISRARNPNPYSKYKRPTYQKKFDHNRAAAISSGGGYERNSPMIKKMKESGLSDDKTGEVMRQVKFAIPSQKI